MTAVAMAKPGMLGPKRVKLLPLLKPLPRALELREAKLAPIPKMMRPKPIATPRKGECE